MLLWTACYGKVPRNRQASAEERVSLCRMGSGERYSCLTFTQTCPTHPRDWALRPLLVKSPLGSGSGRLSADIWLDSALFADYYDNTFMKLSSSALHGPLTRHSALLPIRVIEALKVGPREYRGQCTCYDENGQHYRSCIHPVVAEGRYVSDVIFT